MKKLTLDFETYYDRDFSLRKLTTEEYIRDPRFEVIGVAVHDDSDDSSRWCSGTLHEIKDFFEQFDMPNSLCIAHNSVFDMAILNWHFDLRPKRIADTLSMARAIYGTDVGGSLAALSEYYGIGKKGTEVLQAIGKRREDFTPLELKDYGRYCVNDVELTRQLFDLMLAGFPVDELRLIDLTVRMFTEPKLVLDADLLTQHLTMVKSAKDSLLRVAGVDREVLMSNIKFAGILDGLGVPIPMKISPTTNKSTYAFSKSDEEFIALLDHEDIRVQTLVAARLGVKSTLEETRTERMLGIAKRGTLPVPLRYYAARTGRWGGDDKMNLQNFPRNSPLKRAICAPPGNVLIDSDSSQIEARTLAWLSGQDDLVEAFERGEDVYKQMASKIYGVDEKDVTKDQRFVGKWTILGCGYGLGGAKYQQQLKNYKVDIPLDECRRIIDVYRQTYPMIPYLWSQAKQAINSMLSDDYMDIGPGAVLKVEGRAGIRLPNGLYLQYNNLQEIEEEGVGRQFVYDMKRGRQVIQTRIYGGKLVENFCQALARVIIGWQMLAVNRKYPVVLTVHDAVTCVVPEAEEFTAKEYVEMCMRIRPDWALDLPLDCEAESASTYGG